MKIANSTALVTGANRGLGQAFAQALLAGGARKVYAAARDPSSIRLPGVVPIRLDVTDREQVAAAVRETGDVDLLINNAGISRGVGVLGADTLASVRDEMETNYFGPLNVSAAYAPVLARHGGGAIVNVLSVLSWLTFPGMGSYSASKAAAWQLTNALRQELAGQGTLVVALHVGYMDTDMTRGIDAPKSLPQDVVRQTLEALEAGRPEVLADQLSRDVRRGLSADPGMYLAPR